MNHAATSTFCPHPLPPPRLSLTNAAPSIRHPRRTAAPHRLEPSGGHQQRTDGTHLQRTRTATEHHPIPFPPRYRQVSRVTLQWIPHDRSFLEGFERWETVHEGPEDVLAATVKGARRAFLLRSFDHLPTFLSLMPSSRLYSSLISYLRAHLLAFSSPILLPSHPIADCIPPRPVAPLIPPSAGLP